VSNLTLRGICLHSFKLHSIPIHSIISRDNTTGARYAELLAQFGKKIRVDYQTVASPSTGSLLYGQKWQPVNNIESAAKPVWNPASSPPQDS